MFIHPALPFLFAALLTLVRGKTPLQKALHLIAPVLAFSCLHPYLPKDGIRELHRLTLPFWGHNRLILKTDDLAIFLSAILLLHAQLISLFSFNEKRKTLLIGHYLSIGASLGAILSGDLFVLFGFWMLLAAGSTLTTREQDSPWNFRSLIQPLMPRLLGVLFFAAALVLRGTHGQSLASGSQPLDTAGMLLFSAFTLNFLLPVLTIRTEDIRPQTPQTDLHLFAFTPLVSVFAFLRCFAGLDWLLYLGALAALLGILFSWAEKDVRKLVFYLLFTLSGLSLTGIGMGSDLGQNGAACLTAGVLFSGATLLMCLHILKERPGGTFHVSTLENLGHKNRDFLGLMLMAALASAGFPGLIVYAGESLLVKAAGSAGLAWVELLVRTAQAAAFLTLSLKIITPALVQAPVKKKSAGNRLPAPTLACLCAAALLCILPGLAPQSFLYSFLPYKVSVHVFDPEFILQTLQIFLGAWTCELWLKRKKTL